MKRLEGTEKGGPLRSLQQGPRRSEHRMNVTESGLLRAATRSVLETRHIRFYFILFVLCWEKKQQDKLHCFYSKSLGFVFFLIYIY